MKIRPMLLLERESKTGRKLRLQRRGMAYREHPRFLADLTGDGRADIVGFGNAGVWVSLNNGDRTF
jgi:hypothetical protein